MLKCLVWDLDDTLWDGILADNYNVKINHKMLEVVKKLNSYGVLQSIASKNDINIVMEKLIQLKIEKYFIYPQCNYNSKVVSIKKIAKNINISLDAVGFIDDSKFELYEVNRYLPDVCTFLASDDNDILQYFEKGNTYESLNRLDMMKLREDRLLLQEKFKGSKESFLKECKMEINVREAKESDINRITELTKRTNKINSMKIVLDEDAIKTILHKKEYVIYVCELKDIFGYHGVVGVCILEEKEEVHINHFCISCRIEGRGIGHGFLNHVIKKYLYKDIVCVYKKLEKNRAGMILLLMVGFKVQEKREECLILKFEKGSKLKEVGFLN
jgi:methoxymalonate biosynthesis protein